MFVYADVLDPADSAARMAVDLVAQEVGRRVRARLWASAARTSAAGAAAVGAAQAEAAGRLPAADSVLGHLELNGRVHAVAYRGGRLAWRVERPSSPDTAAVGLVARALREARDSGEVLVVDDVIRGDSLPFQLALTWPTPDTTGGPLGRITTRNPTPVFTAPVLSEAQATVLGGLRPRYPDRLQRGGFEGRVLLEFVVDSAGRTEAATVRDLNAAAVARLDRSLREAYSELFEASRDAVLRARFQPALVGGCRVRQRVRQTIGYRFNR